MELGERIRQLRAKNRLSQGDLAKAVESATSTISEIERGERSPRIELLVKIADYFGVSTDSLLGRGPDELTKKLEFLTEQVTSLRLDYMTRARELQEIIERAKEVYEPADEKLIEMFGGAVPELVDENTRGRLEKDFDLKVRDSRLNEVLVNTVFRFLLGVKKMEEKGWRLSKKGVNEEGEAETGNG